MGATELSLVVCRKATVDSGNTEAVLSLHGSVLWTDIQVTHTSHHGLLMLAGKAWRWTGKSLPSLVFSAPFGASYICLSGVFSISHGGYSLPYQSGGIHAGESAILSCPL